MIIDMEDKQVLNFNLGPCNLIYNRFVFIQLMKLAMLPLLHKIYYKS